MRKIVTLYNISLLLFLVSAHILLAGEIKYSVNDIPEELKQNAKAVIRVEETSFEIASTKEAVEKITFAITILNKNGEELSKFINFYDKFHKIRNINGVVYNGEGNLVKKIRLDKILDYSAVSGYTMYSDSRVKYIDPEYRTYPYTVEYTYEINYIGLLFYPTWDIYKDYNVAVQKSIFTITSPQDIQFRYLEKNFTDKIIKDFDNNRYSWQTENLCAIEDEPYSTEIIKSAPVVYTAPNDFEIEEYPGNFETWENFGRWINFLNNSKDILNEETKQHLSELVKEYNSDLEKIKVLYEFLQNKTRYVSIQIGIGGWQPFPAKTIDELGYGDCKALANYMKSILSAVGIKSYYTLVRAGVNEPNIMKDFPSNQFNHAFLCVPLDNDTTWLECTSQTNPFGYLGHFTSDRDVLVITEEGGKIVHTPVYGQQVNTQHRTAEVIINEAGNGQAHVKTVYAGLQYENISDILYEKPEEQKKWLYKDIDLPSFEIDSFHIDNYKERIPNAELQLNLNLRNYASISGNRMFIPANLMNKRTNIPKKIDNRQTDVVLRSAYIDVDTIQYTLPEKYEIEYLPEPITINSDFGEFTMAVSTMGSTITYIRQIKMNKGTYPAASYENLRNFFRDIVNADKKKIVLVKNKI